MIEVMSLDSNFRNISTSDILQPSEISEMSLGSEIEIVPEKYRSSKRRICVECGKHRKVSNYDIEKCRLCQLLKKSGIDFIDNFLRRVAATYFENLGAILEWIPYDEFSDIEQIGQGSYSQVFKAKWSKGYIERWNPIIGKLIRSESLNVVLKVLENSCDMNSDFLKELECLYQFQTARSEHRNIVRCYGVSRCPNDPKNYIFVMQYANNGDLRSYMNSNFNRISWYTKRKIAQNLFEAIKEIHEKKIIHRDLHSGNVLIQKSQKKTHSLITGLECCRLMNEKDGPSSICGVMPYMAPEIFNGKPFSVQSDIYSLGMIMWELTSGCRPFYKRAYDLRLILDICNGLRPTITEDTPKGWEDIMRKCWDSDPLKRPTVYEIIEDLKILKHFQKSEEKRRQMVKFGIPFVEEVESHHSGLDDITQSLKDDFDIMNLPNSNDSNNTGDTFKDELDIMNSP